MSIKDWIKSQMDIHTVYLTENRCYQRNQKMRVSGLMLHSTGANNPRLSRYVAPDDGRLGRPSNNHWNQYKPGGRSVCVHGFIGRLADGSVAAYQTLPWLTAGWHCGGKANANYIGVEICEDTCDPNRLDCWQYLADTYRQAALLFAYLCCRYDLNPERDGVILCHAEGHQRGISSNHGDVFMWWRKFGVTMDAFRADVCRLVRGKPMVGVEIPAHLRPKPDVPNLGTDSLPEKEHNEEHNHEEEDTMTYEDWKAYMDRWTAEKAAEKATMPELLKEAGAMGITDMTRPMSYCSRQESAVMCRKVQVNMMEKLPGLVQAELDKLTIDHADLANVGTKERCNPDGDYSSIDLPEEV